MSHSLVNVVKIPTILAAVESGGRSASCQTARQLIVEVEFPNLPISGIRHQQTSSIYRQASGMTQNAIAQSAEKCHIRRIAPNASEPMI